MSERSERHSTSWLLGSAAHYTTWWGERGFCRRCLGRVLSPVRALESRSWVYSIFVTCRLLSRIRATGFSLSLGGKQCVCLGTVILCPGARMLHRGAHSFSCRGILYKWNFFVDTPLISFLLSGLKSRAIRFTRKQVPTTMLSFLKQLVDARSSVAFVCDVWMPLAIFSYLRGILEPFQPAYIELSI